MSVDYSGRLATKAGDVNGDGFGDLIIGANSADPGGRDLAGESYVVFGVKPVDAVTRVGSAADQKISGGLGDDLLSGLGGADALYGHEGNDELNGGSGNDLMVGGAGDDLYVLSGSGDVVVEAPNAGRDTIQAAFSLTLDATIENLIMFGVAAIDGTGNQFSNTMTGNSAANTLTGLGGADRLDGKGGADTMVGGKGNEIYYVDDAGDVVTELANEGVDLVRSTLAIDLTSILNVENATVTSAADVDIEGSDADNVLTGGNGSNEIDGGAGNDTIRGNFGSDTLIGGTGADTFVWIGINESRLSAPDLVADFESGIDKLDLRGIDARASIAGNQDFVLDTNGDFAQGEIRLIDHGTFLMLEANTDLDPAVELAIQIRRYQQSFGERLPVALIVTSQFCRKAFCSSLAKPGRCPIRVKLVSQGVAYLRLALSSGVGQAAMNVVIGVEQDVERDGADDDADEASRDHGVSAPERRDVGLVEEVLRGKYPGNPGLGRRTTGP